MKFFSSLTGSSSVMDPKDISSLTLLVTIAGFSLDEDMFVLYGGVDVFALYDDVDIVAFNDDVDELKKN